MAFQSLVVVVAAKGSRGRLRVRLGRNHGWISGADWQEKERAIGVMVLESPRYWASGGSAGRGERKAKGWWRSLNFSIATLAAVTLHGSPSAQCLRHATCAEIQSKRTAHSRTVMLICRRKDPLPPRMLVSRSSCRRVYADGLRRLEICLQMQTQDHRHEMDRHQHPTQASKGQ